MKFLNSLALAFLLITSCSKAPETVEVPPIIPKPKSLVHHAGSFELIKSGSISISSDKDFRNTSLFLEHFLLKAGAEISRPKEGARIRIEKNDTLTNPEAYTLSISENNILITASDNLGAFYGVQTLRQLLPANLESTETISEPIFLPIVDIYDQPTFSYRGMHLDVGRHFFPKEFIKEYISHLAMLKMNYFHWHLTEDQGWRIEIKEYPRLTTHAAYRDETLIGHYSDTPHQFDGERYGGFYTQEEIREIVDYATKLNVTIIPEIEMPGHAQAAVSAYPELGCTKEQVPVATKWGVFENIYCPNQKTFAFLQNVLTEVADLFPGEYIHIGGDEAPKAQWESCEHCQKLIRELDLKDENGLQSYFIKEIETFLNGKGKRIIGWDEILEGGLAPNATVMSWRGTEGGIEAAKEGHDVIMSPTSHAYFDYYQDDDPNEPLAIGGLLPLEKVYSFNPIPSELTPEEAKHILGAQGNVWTEYMKTTDKVEYMVFPRILAMSEVVWSGPTEDPETSYLEFLSRLEPFYARLNALEINAANHLNQVEGSVKKNQGDTPLSFELKTPIEGKDIMYRLNGGDFLNYQDPIAIPENTVIHSFVTKDGEPIGPTRTDSIVFHKGVLGTVSLNVEPHPAYASGGTEAIANGIIGSDSRYGDGEWLGFWGDNLEVEISFDKPIKVSSVKTRFHNGNGQWIYAPELVALRITTKDNETIANKFLTKAVEGALIVDVDMPVQENPQVYATKIVLQIPNYGMIPQGKQGAGHPAWTFIDEIVIE